MEPGPFLTLNLNTVLQAIIIVVGGFALKAGREWMREIRSTVGNHSDKIVQLETWREAHDKQDDERYERTRVHYTNLWAEVRHLQKKD